MIIWDLSKFKCSKMVLESFSITFKLCFEEEGSFWLTLVYNPNNSNLSKDLWVELQDLFGLTYPKWCEDGDFNVIRRILKKMCVFRLTSSMRCFDEFIKESGLIDPTLRNTTFTCSNMQASPICKRLDRFLFSNKWDLFFPQSLQEALPRWSSNHKPN